MLISIYMAQGKPETSVVFIQMMGSFFTFYPVVYPFRLRLLAVFT